MKKVHVLSIGINEYDNFRTLGGCVNDSKNIKQSFSARYSGMTGVLVNDENTTPTAWLINNELTKIKALGYDRDDVVIFFFAGHGFSLDGKDYITAKDTNLDKLDTAISTDNIIDCFKKSGAGNVVLIIDACRTDIHRGVDIFGERTAEISRRHGVVTYFSCSPGETAKELAILNGGIFTTAFSELLNKKDVPFTPFSFNRLLIQALSVVCGQHKLGKQTPYTAVAPLEKAIYDVFSGLNHDVDIQKKEMILVLGPSNAGKTTIGQFLAKEHGYIHAEMSSYAWKRFNEHKDYRGSMLDFMEHEVWSGGNEDAIAKDLIQSNIVGGKIVVCGARRVEEVKTLMAQGWDVIPIFIFANAGVRYKRIQHSSGRYGPNYEEFIKKDLKEFSWGIADMVQLKNIELIINEGDIEACFSKVRALIK
ncbi:caspase family protein [Pseudomonas sp. NPDC087342]|uniref:caspase family protein n=1 Tax=Pseudomonas sp. NPDC087342 TaxID=3364437 RepID=UPI00381A408E